MTSYNLQTLAYIQTIDNLLQRLREPRSEEEIALLSEFKATSKLLNKTFHISYLVVFWNTTESSAELVVRRKNLIKSLDILFHKHYKKLNASFKKLREIYIEIAPGITEILRVYSIPAVQDLVELYAKKSEMFQKCLYRNELPLVEEEKDEMYIDFGVETVSY